MTKTNQHLLGKIALVTGGSRGVGRDIALRLAEAGADVILTYRAQAEAAQAVAHEIRRGERRAEILPVDLDGIGEVDAFAATVGGVLEAWGADGLDMLVNNAGVGAYETLGSITEEGFDRIVNTNYKSVVFLTQALLPRMNDGGRIIGIGSGLSRFSMAGYAVYGSMKAALERFMAYLALELGPRGITANAISPGALATDFNAAALEQNPGLRDFIGSVTALGRMGEANDIGAAVAMLCSPAGAWITGQRIEVSGGMFL